MSHRRNKNNDDDMAMLIGAGIAGIATIATMAVSAALSNRNDDGERRRSSSPGPSVLDVLNTFTTVAGATAATVSALSNIVDQPSSSRRGISISEINGPEREERQTQCKICNRKLFLQPVEDLKCKHKFHSTCIRKWMTDSYECPVCGRRARLA